MTPDRWIGLVSSVAGCMAAIAAYGAIWQSSKQRQASYRPDLVLLQTTLRCGANPFVAGASPDNWCVWDAQGQAVLNETIVSLPVKNVGLGAAKSVEFEWNFSLAQSLARIERIIQKAKTNCSVSLEKGMLCCTSENGNRFFAVLGTENTCKVDYIVAAPTDSATVLIPVPPEYLLVVAALVHLDWKTGAKGGAISIPPLTLTMRYKDIGGKGHSAGREFPTDLFLSCSEDSTFVGEFETGYRA